MSDAGGARIIFKSRYAKPYKNGSGGTARFAAYIGTRDGCVRIADSSRSLPATEAQKKMIRELRDVVPDTENLISYYEYQKSPTLGRASDFISDALEQNREVITGMEGFARYMAERPQADRVRATGLFSDGSQEVDLKSVQEELKQVQGNVWMLVISLRPEDSAALGYDNPESWHHLIERHRGDFAREYRIPEERMRWIGAYHHAVNQNGITHNHIHLMLWSTDPRDGHQSRQTGVNIRRVLANDIFHEELSQLYRQKTETRDEIKRKASARMAEAVREIEEGGSEEGTQMIDMQLRLLSERLRNVSGRKVYGYLPKDVKKMVDGIMNSLPEADPKVRDLLEAWADCRDRQIRIYSDGHYRLPPLSGIPELKSIKNQIIKSADGLNPAPSLTHSSEETGSGLKERQAKETADNCRGLMRALTGLCTGRSTRPQNQNNTERISSDDQEKLAEIGELHIS